MLAKTVYIKQATYLGKGTTVEFVYTIPTFNRSGKQIANVYEHKSYRPTRKSIERLLNVMRFNHTPSVFATDTVVEFGIHRSAE